MTRLVAALKHPYRGMLSQNTSLADFTSWRVGGEARTLFQPADLEDLSLFLSQLPAEEPLLVLGAGTNVLVRDGGFLGTVIVLSGILNELSQKTENTLRAEAGVSSARLAKMAIDLGLKGVEFLIGIPGTVGGALAMNAGAYGSATWNHVTAVEMINRRGERYVRVPKDFEIGYRSIKKSNDEWFTAGFFCLEKGDPAFLKDEADRMLASRKAKHPLKWPNAGSVFRNPPGFIAGQLIEACGLKGYRIGGASVSEKHANFIVNDRQASAKDIEELMSIVQNRVEKCHGIRLEPEVFIVGSVIK